MISHDILVVESDPLICSFLENAAKKTKSFSIVHCAYSYCTAIHKINSITTIGMLLCEIYLPDGNGCAILTQALNRGIPTIVISEKDDQHSVLQAIKLGANGYLIKGSSRVDIIAAIQLALQGGAPLSPSIAHHLFHQLKANEHIPTGEHQTASQQKAPSNSDALTARETEILQMIAQGYQFKEVAIELRLSLHTISNHNRNIYRKLNARSRSEAVFKAMENGIIGNGD